jgi:hypothetical protein
MHLINCKVPISVCAMRSVNIDYMWKFVKRFDLCGCSEANMGVRSISAFNSTHLSMNSQSIKEFRQGFYFMKNRTGNILN